MVTVAEKPAGKIEALQGMPHIVPVVESNVRESEATSLDLRSSAVSAPLDFISQENLADGAGQKLVEPKSMGTYYPSSDLSATPSVTATNPPILGSPITAGTSVNAPTLTSRPASTRPSDDSARTPRHSPPSSNTHVDQASPIVPPEPQPLVVDYSALSEDDAVSELTSLDETAVLDSPVDLEEPESLELANPAVLDAQEPSPDHVTGTVQSPPTATQLNSSLNQLNQALERLKDPSRPNTSMGFHRSLSDTDSSLSKEHVLGDPIVGHSKGKGKERPRPSSVMSTSAIPKIAKARDKPRGKSIAPLSAGQKNLTQTKLMLPPAPPKSTRPGLRSTARSTAATEPTTPAAASVGAHGPSKLGGATDKLGVESQVCSVDQSSAIV